ncbi:alkene reductase [Marinobacterium sediminicola]|uniref:2,4-dienoyl-CoA reductase n=1 Tax=Marinobacterium sediminicola TaxID=518898 RepID=A0ABY1S0P1_9GAMM|nr:alkene reductase [Marinobacterium sediminicola]ULG68342.1 alkene reductase [Marinobacterium sediminicola]SMR74779.1 2,4-dienoyl-CoA reductase [Marinobacterium sediminicola]
MPTLFDPLRAGALNLRNRIVMAPLTRCRAEADRVPGELMVEYYRQRANAGLIISEATSITPMGVGYPDTPGIWSEAQVEGWKKVTDAVHAEGGLIILQLWHVGRISHPSYLNGETPVAPSAIRPDGHVSLIRPKTPYVTPRALETDEIPAIIEAYRKGAENAKRAGFDGVEIHGANGYLLEQFLLDGTNHRSDQYGGSLENRARLMLEVTDAVISVWGADRVGMHLSPRADSHYVSCSDRELTYGYVAEALGKRGLAFICTREHVADDSISLMLKEKFGGVYIANESFTAESAQNYVADGHADAVAFGKPYIANPDLAVRIAQGADWNEQDPATFYASTAKGYTDYPALS